MKANKFRELKGSDSPSPSPESNETPHQTAAMTQNAALERDFGDDARRHFNN